MNKPNWDLVNRCGIWRVLGVTECNNCSSCSECWGSDSELPEPTREGMEGLGGVLGGMIKDRYPTLELEVPNPKGVY